jgi:serine/threonine protein phosphatase PrpC
MKSAFFTKNAAIKPVNGDFGGVFKVNKATIGLLADGESTKPCDWKAAHAAVDGFLERAHTFENFDTDDQVKNCIMAAQKCVAELHGICSGAATSFSAVVCLDNGQYWCANFGDATIFKFNGTSSLELIGTTAKMGEITLESGQLIPVPVCYNTQHVHFYLICSIGFKVRSPIKKQIFYCNSLH